MKKLINLKKLMELTLDGIKSVSRDTWKKYYTHIEKLEAEHLKTVRLVEDTVKTMNYDVWSESET